MYFKYNIIIAASKTINKSHRWAGHSYRACYLNLGYTREERLDDQVRPKPATRARGFMFRVVIAMSVYRKRNTLTHSLRHGHWQPRALQYNVD